MPVSQGTPASNAPLVGVGGVDSHVKIRVMNTCMAGSYFYVCSKCGARSLFAVIHNDLGLGGQSDLGQDMPP